MDLPHDIWIQIANYLPHDDRSALISLNRSLFNIVLDERYQEVQWAKMDGGMAKSLIRLREPSIACRVRRLHIRAWFIGYLFRKDVLFKENSLLHPPPRQWHTEWSEWLKGLWIGAAPEPEQVNEPTVSSKSMAPDMSPEETLEAMIDAVHCMTGVTEYIFEWRDLPLTPLTQKFLASARQSFGPTLRKLVLHAQPSCFRQLLSTVDFDGLEELEFHFDYESLDNGAPTESNKKSAALAVLVDCVAPFVNHFTSSLSALTISCQSEIDLSTFFIALRDFAHLQTLNITISFAPAHLSDPSGLYRLLSTHTDTLLRVELRPTASKETSLAWDAIAQHLMSHPRTFRDLQSLTISPFDPPARLACYRCLQRSANTLTTLRLVGCYLAYDEVAQVVGVFSGRPFDQSLQNLHIEVTTLDRQLFDLLANQLPGLDSLHIVFKDVLSLSNVTFGTRMYGVSYPDWHLYDIGIWAVRWTHPKDRTSQYLWEESLMRVVQQRLPSVGAFKGIEVAPPDPELLPWVHSLQGRGFLAVGPV